MGALLAMRDAIVAGIKALPLQLAACEPYHASVTDEEIARTFVRPPVVLVVFGGAVIGGPIGGMTTAKVGWTAFVVTAGPKPGLREGQGLAIVEALLQHLPKARWGLDSVEAAAEIRAEPVNTPTLDERAVSVWDVSWSQSLELPERIDEATLGDFARLCTTFDLPEKEQAIQGDISLPTE